MDGTLELTHSDPHPLEAGTIAFETLEDSAAQIDDVTVSAEAVRRIDLDTGPMLSLRTLGLPFILGNSAQELFQPAEETFHEAILQADRGERREAGRILREVEDFYREAILTGLSEGLFEQPERWMEDERLDLTPEKLEQAQDWFDQAKEPHRCGSSQGGAGGRGRRAGSAGENRQEAVRSSR